MVFLVPKMLNKINCSELHVSAWEVPCDRNIVSLPPFGFVWFVWWLGYFVDLTIELNPINRTFYKSGLLCKTITSCKRGGRIMVMAVWHCLMPFFYSSLSCMMTFTQMMNLPIDPPNKTVSTLVPDLNLLNIETM